MTVSAAHRAPTGPSSVLLGKAVVHVALLLPFLRLLWFVQSGALAREADPVNYITHFTGNWALWILLGALAITPVRKLHRRLAPLARLRRMVGLYAFFYASLHLLTYLFLFSGFDLPGAFESVKSGHPGALPKLWRDVWPTVLADLKRRRFVQVGLLSWVLLLILALTSPQRILRALGGRRWRALHRMVYLAGAAAVVHFWWLVKSGNREPLTDTVVLTVLLLARALPAAAVWWRGRQARSTAPAL